MNAIPGQSSRFGCPGPVVVDAPLVKRGAEAGTEDESPFLPDGTRLAPVEALSVLMSTERSDRLFGKVKSPTALRGFGLTEFERAGQAIALERSPDRDRSSGPVN